MADPTMHKDKLPGIEEDAFYPIQENQVLLIAETFREEKAELSKEKVPMADKTKPGDKSIVKNIIFAIPKKALDGKMSQARMEKQNLSGVNIDVGVNQKAAKKLEKKEMFSIWKFSRLEIIPPQMELSIIAFLAFIFLITSLTTLIVASHRMKSGCRKDYEVAIPKMYGDYIWDEKAHREVNMWNKFKSSSMCSEEKKKILQDYKPQMFCPTVEDDYNHFESETEYAEDRIAKDEFELFSRYYLRKNPNRTSSLVVDDWIPVVRHIAVIAHDHLLKIEWTPQFTNSSCLYCVVLTNEDRNIFGHQISTDGEIKIRLPHDYFYIAQIKVAYGATIYHSKQTLISTKPIRELRGRFFSAYSEYAVFSFNDQVLRVNYRDIKYVLFANVLSLMLFVGMLSIIGFQELIREVKRYFSTLKIN